MVEDIDELFERVKKVRDEFPENHLVQTQVSELQRSYQAWKNRSVINSPLKDQREKMIRKCDELFALASSLRRKKKRFWHSPLFWTIMGTFIALCAWLFPRSPN